MPAASPASIIDAVVGLALGSTGQDASNRVSIEGLAFRPANDGAHEIGIRKLEAASLRIASGPLVLEVGHFALHELAAQVRFEAGRPRLRSLAVASAEISGVKIEGPAGTDSAAGPAAAGAWCLGPLAAADGTIRAKIVDAHLLFDADVTVPIRHGKIDFADATVEHVGPDSRMGVSRLGLYVDAPNGRSYLYQFPSAPVAGVAYEKRGALLGPWVTNRGSLRLQEFGEGLLRQAGARAGAGFTDQARLLFDRTAISGDLRLSDGKFAAPGVHADMAGRAEGRNVVSLHSEAVGRGLTAEMPSLSVRNAVLGAGDALMACDQVEAALVLRLFIDGPKLRFTFDLPNMKLSGLHLHLQRALPADEGPTAD